MAIKTLADNTIAYAIASEDDWAFAKITVFGAGTAFFGPNKEQLEMPEGGTQQGAQYTAANTSGNSQPGDIRFIGTLFARGSLAKMQIDVTVFARRPSVLKVQRSHR